LYQNAPQNQGNEQIGVLLDVDITLRVGENGPPALYLGLEDDLGSVVRILKERELQEEIGSLVEDAGPPVAKAVDQVRIQVHLHPRIQV
jgi:hypothetical protein